jgi:DNA-binding NtrC family response regulator
MVLVVEDQQNEREAIVRFLTAEDFAARGVDSPQAALEFAAADVDVVLSDVRLGAISGISLLKMWKERRPSTPFVLITAFAEIGDAVEAIKAGAADYLVKPVKPPELLAKINQCLAGAHKANARLQDLPLEEIERAAIEQALDHFDQNRTRAARSLGISVRTLQRKLKAWGDGASSQEVRK